MIPASTTLVMLHLPFIHPILLPFLLFLEHKAARTLVPFDGVAPSSKMGYQVAGRCFASLVLSLPPRWVFKLQKGALLLWSCFFF